MSLGVTVRTRGLALEDLLTSGVFGKTTATVLGLGDGIPVTPILAAASDTSASLAGLSVGDVYLLSGATPNRLRSVQAPAIPIVTRLTASGNLTIGQVNDGTGVIFSNAITLTGAVPGDVVCLGCTPELPAGVQAFGKVASTNIIDIEVWCLSGGGGAALGTFTFTVSVFH